MNAEVSRHVTCIISEHFIFIYLQEIKSFLCSCHSVDNVNAVWVQRQTSAPKTGYNNNNNNLFIVNTMYFFICFWIEVNCSFLCLTGTKLNRVFLQMAPAGSPARISRFTSLLVSAPSLNILLCQRTMSPRFTQTLHWTKSVCWAVECLQDMEQQWTQAKCVWFPLP